MVAGFQNAIDTSVRSFTIWQEATRTLINTSATFNPLLYTANNTGILNTPNFNTISGRVLYDKQQEYAFARPYVGRGPNEGQVKIKDQTTRSVRIKVDATGYALMNTCKEVDIDGFAFVLESVPRPHGLFVPNQYTFYFVRKL